MTRYDLAQLPLVKPLLKSRWPQWIIQAIALAGFIFAIIAGFIGTPVGSRNFSIVFVWIGWWALLMLIAVPMFGRGWCSVCPIPLPGEWLQRGAVIAPNIKGGFTLGRRWPNKLRNIWLQNGSFALVALFSAVALTQPSVTAIVLAAFLFLAVGASLIFERRAFCRYLCPVGGFIGLYSQLAPIEVRAKDPSLCATHTEKTCYTGSADGYGCPWQVFPGGLTKNTYCGTCVECLRTCPHDNIAINLRPLGADLQQPTGRRLDEAFKAFIMLGSAMAYSLVMLGPWGAAKTAAYSVGSMAWAGYAAAFLIFIFGLLPGLFWIAVALSKKIRPHPRPLPRKRERGKGEGGTRKAFVSFSYALIPLGLTAWVAFSLSFVLANISYLWPAISDPLGWGWNLFGTAAMEWTPHLAQAAPTLQVIALVGGLLWASATARQIAGDLKYSTRASLPVIAFCAAVAVGMLWLLVG